ncbi:hypothetical protein [Massilia cavernae]|uniref:Uncharacterized protein n=1 Tax=Massilia cavernae TaxID=2320864 RepID=A0A418Y6B2_9BURK|nr:hypothetical protein [Massilia cavernae]RJG23245.1 hypothetical protein D3872_04735 [Massilia cavernae]
MTYQDQQPEKPQQTAPAQPAASISSRGAARRRFARAGLGVSGALVTITSRATMTCEICKPPSGSLSGGLTSHHGPPPVCEGRSPGYWQTHSYWPCSPTITFGSIFSCAQSSKYYNCSIKDILDPKQWDKDAIGRHMVATYLNIISGKISFLTVIQLQNIWNDLYRRGYYNPTAGVKWYAADVVTYLKGTML